MAAAGDFNIKRFDMSKLKDHKTVVVIGRRGTGKTTLITDILHAKRNLPAGIVATGQFLLDRLAKGQAALHITRVILRRPKAADAGVQRLVQIARGRHQGMAKTVMFHGVIPFISHW